MSGLTRKPGAGGQGETTENFDDLLPVAPASAVALSERVD
ncbi:hypothetical protein SBV1_2330003 [Verrucomicrobia bacterium]|nr:hypothetical protein SBV1_2330003 [Verrucomicrobiota bacterium]